MTTEKLTFYPPLQTYIEAQRSEAALIPESRKTLLHRLAEYIREKRRANDLAQLNFICTHNSRRSLISQAWAFAAAAYLGIENIATYSGGTEATAFNPRAVAALERVGFKIEKPGGENPRYRLAFGENGPVLEAFSKTFDDPYNPAKGFAAIITCAQADEACPFVPGAEFRLSLTYEDPKVADGTPEETARYDERVRQIGREIFYAFQQVAQADE